MWPVALSGAKRAALFAFRPDRNSIRSDRMQEPAMLTAIKHQNASTLPFDNHLLDRLMDEAHIDVALTTSKHNVQYRAWRSPHVFLRSHGSNGAEPLSASASVSQRRARTGLVCRPWVRAFPACPKPVLDAGSVHRAG